MVTELRENSERILEMREKIKDQIEGNNKEENINQEEEEEDKEEVVVDNNMVVEDKKEKEMSIRETGN